VIKVGLAILCVCCLAGCTSNYSSSDKQQYLASRNGETLVIPPPLTNANVSGFYDLPSPEGPSKVSVTPPQV
jgi:uncharacterized lipoprotein